MTSNTDFLLGIRAAMKFQDSLLKQLSETYGLTLIEANVITFLHNNPGKDTAADITELRMLSKGNVSQAVESLIQKALLKKSASSIQTPDPPGSAARLTLHYC